jgi:hypothetical protein
MTKTAKTRQTVQRCITLLEDELRLAKIAAAGPEPEYGARYVALALRKVAPLLLELGPAIRSTGCSLPVVRRAPGLRPTPRHSEPAGRAARASSAAPLNWRDVAEPASPLARAS